MELLFIGLKSVGIFLILYIVIRTGLKTLDWGLVGAILGAIIGPFFLGVSPLVGAVGTGLVAGIIRFLLIVTGKHKV